MKDVHELERYTTIDGFPDYLITSHGRVFSLKYGKLKEMKQVKNKNGYLSVLLYKNAKSYRRWVHRLVAQAFIPNHENKPEINHIDEDKTNNHVSNLEWMTHKENMNFGTRNERAGKAISKTNGDGRLKGKRHSEETKQKLRGIRGTKRYNAKSVIGFKINGCDIKYYNFIADCKKDEFDCSCIVRCCRKQYKTHKGYVWYYTDEFFNKNK